MPSVMDLPGHGHAAESISTTPGPQAMPSSITAAVDTAVSVQPHCLPFSQDFDETERMDDADEDPIWTVDVERAFQEAYELFPNTGRTKARGADGRLYGRNELISQYIYEKTGKIRTRKQVSSHIQVLVKKCAKELDAPELLLKVKPSSLRKYSMVSSSDADAVQFAASSMSVAPMVHPLPTPTSMASSPTASAIISQQLPTPTPKRRRATTGSSTTLITDSQTSSTSTSRRSSVEMILSAAIYVDHAKAVPLSDHRDEVLTRMSASSSSNSISSTVSIDDAVTPLVIRMFDLRFVSPTFDVRCVLESTRPLEVDACTQVYSFGRRVLQSEQSRIDSELGMAEEQPNPGARHTFVLDQSALGALLGQMMHSFNPASPHQYQRLLEGLHVRLVLKWRSSDTPSSVTTRDHYFVIRYGGGAPHNLTLCYIPLLGDAPATVTNDQLSFAPASFDVALA